MTKYDYMNEILFVLRINYYLLNMTNHVKVEALLDPPPSHITLISPYPIYLDFTTIIRNESSIKCKQKKFISMC